MPATSPRDSDDDAADEAGNDKSPVARQYALQDTVTHPDSSGEAPIPHDIEVTIAGTTLSGVTELDMSGKGRKSQYITEVTGNATNQDSNSGGGSGSGNGSGGGSGSGAGSGTTSGGSGSGEDQKTPPLEIDITARLGKQTYDTLAELQDAKEPFTVTVGTETIDQAELVDLDRELTGDQPYTYAATIVVREYRETTVRIPSDSSVNRDQGQTSGPSSEDGESAENADLADQSWLEGSGGIEEAQTDFETVSVDAGTVEQVTLGDGEVLENKLYDVSADGAAIQILPSGTGWHLRNIGIRGVQAGNDFPIVCKPTDGDCVIENVFLGDGGEPGASSGGIFVHYDPPSNGTLTLNRLNIQQFTNNGFYGSAPAKRGQDLRIAVNNCYFYSNNIANIRLGSASGTCYVRNSVVAVDRSAVYPCDHACSDPGAVNPRGIWAWNGPVQVINSDIEGPVQTKNGGSVNWQNSRRGDNANRRSPKGVPLTPEAAAGGD